MHMQVTHGASRHDSAHCNKVVFCLATLLSVVCRESTSTQVYFAGLQRNALEYSWPSLSEGANLMADSWLMGQRGTDFDPVCRDLMPH